MDRPGKCAELIESMRAHLSEHTRTFRESQQPTERRDAYTYLSTLSQLGHEARHVLAGTGERPTVARLSNAELAKRYPKEGRIA